MNFGDLRISTTSRTVLPNSVLAITYVANWRNDAMKDDIIPLLKVHEYFHGVSDEALEEIVRSAQVTYHEAGEVVHEANELLSNVGFVLRGRLKAVRVDARGRRVALPHDRARRTVRDDDRSHLRAGAHPGGGA